MDAIGPCRGLGSRLTVCGQAVNKTLFTIILQLQFWSTFRLFEYILCVNNFVPVDLWLVFGANASYIVWLLNLAETIVFLVNHYY